MQAEVIVITMKSWEAHKEDQGLETGREDAMEAFSRARKRIALQAADMKRKMNAEGGSTSINELQVNKFLYTTLKLNATILRYSRMAAVVLVSLPPPPPNHPPYLYMEYMDLLVENIPRLLMVRGYRKDVVTLFT